MRDLVCKFDEFINSQVTRADGVLESTTDAPEVTLRADALYNATAVIEHITDSLMFLVFLPSIVKTTLAYKKLEENLPGIFSFCFFCSCFSFCLCLSFWSCSIPAQTPHPSRRCRTPHRRTRRRGPESKQRQSSD